MSGQKFTADEIARADALNAEYRAACVSATNRALNSGTTYAVYYDRGHYTARPYGASPAVPCFLAYADGQSGDVALVKES